MIGGFWSVLFASYFKVRCFVIVLFWAIIDWLSLLCRFFWSFAFLSLAIIKQHLPISFDKKSTHHHDFLQLESFSAKMGEHVTLWFVLTSPSPKCLTEQVNPKSLQRLQYVQCDTTNFTLTLANKIKEKKSTFKIAMGSLLLTWLKLQCTVPDMLISVNPGLKFCSAFCILHSYALLRVTFCVITTVSHSKGSTVYCNLELHVLRWENHAWNLA